MNASRLLPDSTRVAAALILVVLAAGCFDSRPRPTPIEPVVIANLSVQVLAPRAGQAVPTGTDVIVRVSGRDLDRTGLLGIGFMARSFLPGRPLVDSVAIRFAARADTIHEFTLRIPTSMASNTQVDVYGLAFGLGTQTAVSSPSYLIAVRCVNGICR